MSSKTAKKLRWLGYAEPLRGPPEVAVLLSPSLARATLWFAILPGLLALAMALFALRDLAGSPRLWALGLALLFALPVAAAVEYAVRCWRRPILLLWPDGSLAARGVLGWRLAERAALRGYRASKHFGPKQRYLAVWPVGWVTPMTLDSALANELDYLQVRAWLERHLPDLG